MADLKQIIQELNAEISAENPTVSRVLEDGSRVVSYGDGRFAYYKPGESKYTLYDASGNLEGFESQRNVRGGVEYTTFNPEGQQIDQFVASNTPGLAGILAPIALTAMGGYALGPAGSGLLSTPAAAATSAGGMTLFQGGSAEDALKAAALAGALGYGIENLFPSDALKVGKAAVDLAGSGGTVDSITQTLVNQGVPSSTARTIAAEALAGSSASQIASDFAGLTLGGAGSTSLASTAATNPNLVNVLGSTAPAAGPGLLSSVVSAAPAIIPALVSNTTTQQATQPTEQNTNQNQVVVTAPGSVAASGGNIIPGIVPAVVPTPAPAPATEQVEVVEKKQPPPAPGPVVIPAPAPVPAPAPAPTPAPASQPPGEKVEVVDKKDKPIPSLGPAVLTPLPPVPPQVLTELPKPTQPPANNKSLFTPSDILKLIGLLGGIGAGSALSNTGPGSVSVPPSDTQLGTTTPQFGPDYYAAVQRYYNAYMPETPRNVATPLQQWYENKFGA